MAIKAKWNTREDAPEWARGDLREVKDKEGKFLFFTLDVEGSRPKEDVDAMRDSNTTLTRQLEELQARMQGAKTAAEVADMERQIQELRDANATDAEKRLKAELDKELVTVQVGDRQFKVHKGSRTPFETFVKERGDSEKALSEKLQGATTQLRTERITGGTILAAKRLGGFKEKALPHVVREVNEVFQLDPETHEPFRFDPKDPEKKTVLMSKDGKTKATIEDYLRERVESGEVTGVWVDEPKGPRRDVAPPRQGAPGEGSKLNSSDLIRSGLEKRRVGSGA